MTDRSVQVEATIALAFLLTTAGLCVHEASRRIRKARLTLYDILLHFAYVDIITKDSLALWLVLKGACSDAALESKSLGEKREFNNVFFALAGLRAATTVSVKLAVLFLYRNVFTMDNRLFRIAWWASIIYLIPCFITVDLTLYGITYSRTRQPSYPQPEDIHFAELGRAIVAWLNTGADMIILIMPIPFLLQLRIRKSQKLMLALLLCLGSLATMGTWIYAIKLTLGLAHGSIMSAGHSNFILLIGSVVECAIAFACACLATSKPVFSSLWRWAQPLLLKTSFYRRFVERPHQSRTSDNPSELVHELIKETVQVHTDFSPALDLFPSPPRIETPYQRNS